MLATCSWFVSNNVLFVPLFSIRIYGFYDPCLVLILVLTLLLHFFVSLLLFYFFIRIHSNIYLLLCTIFIYIPYYTKKKCQLCELIKWLKLILKVLKMSIYAPLYYI